jgi:hypothetical protein
VGGGAGEKGRQHFLDGANRNGQIQSHLHPAQHAGVDADDGAREVEQRAAAAAGTQGRIRLEKFDA